MLRAGALFVSVTIAFVIAVLISLLVVLAFHYKIQNRENMIQKKLERNVNSAMTLLMDGAYTTQNLENQNQNQSETIDLFGDESDSVQIRKSSWGVFDVASVKAFSGKYSLGKTAEYGYKPDETLSCAIYLTDLSRPLNLCGKTKITGVCYLPEAGVKRGYIENKGFEGATLIDGKINKSKNSLPALDKDILKKISEYHKGTTFPAGNYKEVTLGSDTLINSFLDTTMLVRINGGGGISGKYLSGNIIVYSDKLLSIEQSASLEDIIVVASSVIIRKGFTGNLQAFAIDSVIVEEECRLNYPSAIGLFKKDHKTQQPFIKMLKKSSLTGVVFTNQSEFVTDLMQTMVLVDKEAVLKGQLYVDGFADIKGEVQGSVWCNKFILKTQSSTYENHLMDAVINQTKLSSFYAGSGLLASGRKKRIIKWLE